MSLVDEIAALGSELNANQYRIVRLAAEYDIGLEWDDHGYPTPALAIAKTRILTRWADPGNEHVLLDLAYERTANRLTTAIAKHFAGEETEAETDQRLHDERSVTVSTNGDGMTVIRAVLPPNVGKPIVQAIDTLVAQVAVTPTTESFAEPVTRSRPSSNHAGHPATEPGTGLIPKSGFGGGSLRSRGGGGE